MSVTGLESFLRTVVGEPAAHCPELAKPDAATGYTLPTESPNARPNCAFPTRPTQPGR